jgi:cell wall-associated NlpC family hydrolase
MDVTRFIGLDYASKGRGPDAYDCWGFARHVGKEVFKLDLPDNAHFYDDADEPADAGLAVWQGTRDPRWRMVEAGQPGDFVLLRIGRFSCHIGILVSDDEFLHCLKGRGSTLESIRSLDWADRVMGVWRYA